MEEILKKSLQLMKALARGNDLVQMRMFKRLDTLLQIKVVESELAITLKEVIFPFFLPERFERHYKHTSQFQTNIPNLGAYLCLIAVVVKTFFSTLKQQNRVPTRPGKPGKMRVHLENLEISWNFEKFNKYHG